MSDTNERRALINHLNELIVAYRQTADDEVLAAVGVLSTLAGALCSHETERLMLITARFTENSMRRLTASRN